MDPLGMNRYYLSTVNQGINNPHTILFWSQASYSWLVLLGIDSKKTPSPIPSKPGIFMDFSSSFRLIQRYRRIPWWNQLPYIPLMAHQKHLPRKKKKRKKNTFSSSWHPCNWSTWTKQNVAQKGSKTKLHSRALRPLLRWSVSSLRLV